jgi:hypothetical protein
VVEKDKLEQLAGSASILLEIVLTGYSELKAYLINHEQRYSLLISFITKFVQNIFLSPFFSLSIQEISNDLMMTFLLLFLYSSLVISATNQVYQSLANLIRWSDTVLLRSDKSLDKESVGEIAKSVYEAVHVNQY